MSTLKLDSLTGDLAIEGNALVLLTDAGEETLQRLKTKFKLFKGEWHLDRRAGFPYYEEVLGVKPPRLSRVRGLFLQTLTEDEQVAQVDDLRLTFDSIERRLRVSFAVRLLDGTVLQFSDYILKDSMNA